MVNLTFVELNKCNLKLKIFNRNQLILSLNFYLFLNFSFQNFFNLILESNKERDSVTKLPEINGRFETNHKKNIANKNLKAIDKKFIKYNKPQQLPKNMKNTLTSSFDFTFSNKNTSPKSICSMIGGKSKNRSRCSSIIKIYPNSNKLPSSSIDNIKSLGFNFPNQRHSSKAKDRHKSVVQIFRRDKVVRNLEFKDVGNIDGEAVKKQLKLRQVQNGKKAKPIKIKISSKNLMVAHKNRINQSGSKSHQSAENIKPKVKCGFRLNHSSQFSPLKAPTVTFKQVDDQI